MYIRGGFLIYIEKEKQRRALHSLFSTVSKNNKNEREKIVVPFDINTKKEKVIKKISKKVINMIKENEYSNILIEKELKENELFLNMLWGQKINIVDGRMMYQMLIEKIVEYIVIKKDIDIRQTSISIFANRTNKYIDKAIYNLAKNAKRINIITNNRTKFEALEEKIKEEYGILLNISSNKKKGAIKSEVVINYDFPQELINKCNVSDEAVIINVLYNTIILKKRYNGININNYEVVEKKKILNDNMHEGFDIKEIYESMIIEKRINTMYALDNLEIKHVNINNGII